MDQNIKQALAIAIVRQKRKCNQEAEAWRAKAQRLESQLQQQQASNAALKQWASSILQTSSTSTPSGAHSRAADPATPECIDQNPSIFLPPLALNPGPTANQQQAAPQPLQGCYQSLQQQLLLTAQQAGSHSGAALQVLDGKAAALSDMLLTNMQMLLKLQQLGHHTGNAPAAAAAAAAPGPAAPAAAASAGDGGGLASLVHAPLADTVSTLSSFIKSTLLQVPSSSLRAAYMQQCAALLAAMLAQPQSPSTAAAEQQQQGQGHSSSHPPSQDAAPQAGRPLQQLRQKQAHQAEAVAVQAVHLMRHLLTVKMGASSITSNAHRQQQQQFAPAAAASTGSSESSAATAMLQQLSSFPSTALLMSLAVAQQLQQQVQQLQQANAAMASVQMCSLGRGMQLGVRALGVAAQLFEASHELLDELEQAVKQLPIWAVALAGCSWTPRALEDLVGMACSMYNSCQGLQQHQPLLAAQICELCAGLATSLQYLATSAEAPGMRSSAGAALRSVCGGLCMKLRDQFMPGG